jgi:hypothetical protein
MEIKKEWVLRNIWLNQRKYIETVLNHFSMKDCKPIKVLILVGEKLIVEQCPKTQEEIEDMACVPYASVVGRLMYVIICTQPDIDHALGVLITYMSTPKKEHYIVVKKVFIYLCGIKNDAICYQRKPGTDGSKCTRLCKCGLGKRSRSTKVSQYICV